MSQSIFKGIATALITPFRNGEVDFNYNGIAGNNVGKWYITDGQVNFDWSGAYTPPGTDHHYVVVEGGVVRESQG